MIIVEEQLKGVSKMSKYKLKRSIKNALKEIKEGKKSPYDYYFPMNFILERRLKRGGK